MTAETIIAVMTAVTNAVMSVVMSVVMSAGHMKNHEGRNTAVRNQGGMTEMITAVRNQGEMRGSTTVRGGCAFTCCVKSFISVDIPQSALL